MDIKYGSRFLFNLLLVFTLAVVPFTATSSSAISSVQQAARAPSAGTQDTFTLHGTVKDQNGNPVQAGITVTDMVNKPLASLLTDENGDYSVPDLVQETMVVDVSPRDCSRI